MFYYINYRVTSETELRKNYLGLPVEKHILSYFSEKLAILSHSSEFIGPEKFTKKSSKFVDRTAKKPHDNFDLQLTTTA